MMKADTTNGESVAQTDVLSEEDILSLRNSQFSNLSRLILRDLNKPTYKSFFSMYKKRDIARFLRDPAKYERRLRDAVRHIYVASSHFRRLIQYFTGLSDLSYIVEPYKIDPKKSNPKMINLNYRRVLNTLSSMSVKTQFPQILTVCLREDVFYGTLWVTQENITVQQLPSDWCAIATVEGNVPNVTFDFSYFDTRPDMLEYYPEEFRIRYDKYKDPLNRDVGRWQELSAPNSFAIKCSNDILAYAIPPFVGILREVFELEDYKTMKLAKTALENYAMLAMRLPMTDDGRWGIDYKKAVEFWQNLDSVLPDEVGSVLTPMPIEKISFERNRNGDSDTITDAEQSLYSAAGVSSLLFNNAKASANALLLSIKADQSVTYGIVKSIEDMINRFIRYQSYGKNFRVNFLDVSPFNRKEVGDAYLKAASYGLPTICAYAASQGIGQEELDSMSFLEGTVLELQKMFKPIVSSTQLPSEDLEGNGATDEGGAPRKDVGDITESGEQNQEDA